MPISISKGKRLMISKYWLELNNWKLPFPGHIGVALWGPLKGIHESEYNFIKESLKKFGELTIIHYMGSKHREINGFIGESKLYHKKQDYRTYYWIELVEKLKMLFNIKGYSEEEINAYIEEAEKHVKKYLVRGTKTRFFLLFLTDFKEYNRLLSFKEIHFAKNIVLQGRYLIPLQPSEYREINSKGFSAKSIDKAILVARKKSIASIKLIDYREFVDHVNKLGGVYSEEVLNSVVLGYNKGKHLLLVGPPGVGKSFLAELLANYLEYELIRTTASSSWTRYDFIGGPIITKEGFVWKSGILLKALAKHIEYISGNKDWNGVILLIDELNRCEADKVLSEFFTIYSGIDPEQWKLPEALIHEIKSFDNKIDNEAKIILDYIETHKSLPWGFRLIATINTWDITHLYTLGYALLRRFHIIEIQPRKIADDVEVFKKILFYRASKIIKKTGNVDNQQLNEIIEKITDVSKIFVNNGFPLGMAYVIEATIDAYNIIKSKIFNKTVEEAVDIALSNTLSSILSPEISKIMLPRKYIESLIKIRKNKELSKYRGIAELVNKIVSAI